MKKRIVLTFGTFDGLHPGHEYYLSQAKTYGDHVVTIIATDTTIRQHKHREPYHLQEERLQQLRATGRSDEIVLWRESGFEWCLEEYKPDVICMGYDQWDISGKIKQYDIPMVRIDSYHPEWYKSSIVMKKKI